MSNTLYELTAQMRQIEEQLDETGGELTPELEDLWNETGESLVQKVDNYNALLIKIENYSENLSNEIKRLQNLKKTADNSVARIKGHIKDTMVANGFSKLEGAYCKMSLSSSTSTVVDEDLLLQPYNHKIQALQDSFPSWLTIEPKVSKSELKNAYKDKDVTPAGVQFVKGTQ
ncbi:MAG: siphovirus Gp157 family protein [Bacteroidales bacterium]|nr:siphovirus Gp157 family protein [Bacteroidales bacterium]